MKKLGLVLILFVTLILVGIGTVKAMQTSDFGTVLAFTLFVRLALPPAILVTIIIAILSHREEH